MTKAKTKKLESRYALRTINPKYYGVVNISEMLSDDTILKNKKN
jgi:hypothetical protein